MKRRQKVKKSSKKAKESTQHTPPQKEHEEGQSDEESNHENGSKVEGTQEILLQGEWDPEELGEMGLVDVPPYRVRDEIFRFICSWMYSFMWLLAVTFVILVFKRPDFLGYNYDETVWKIVLIICLTTFLAALSALFALKDLPGLPKFILKSEGIFSFLIVGISTIFILSRSNLLGFNFDETTVKIVDWISIIWFMFVISTGVSLFAIYDTLKMKIHLEEFGRFVSICALTFSAILLVVILAIIIFGNNLSGFNFDDTFRTIVAVVIYTIGVAYIVGVYAWEHHSDISSFGFHWKKLFLFVFPVSSFVIIVLTAFFIGGGFYGNLAKAMLVAGVTFLIAAASALLALKEFPGLLTFGLKFIGIFFFIVTGISAIAILLRDCFFSIDFDETFVNTVDCLCILWWISVMSAGIACANISNPFELKANLYDLVLFFSLYLFLFCGYLVALIAVIFYFGNSLFGINFDKTFFTIVASLLGTTCLAVVSGIYAWFSQEDWTGRPNWKSALYEIKNVFMICKSIWHKVLALLRAGWRKISRRLLRS